MPEAKSNTPKKEAGTKDKKPSNRSNFSKLYPEDAKLKVLVKENPKKAGSKSAARFEGYTGAKTVGDALVAGVTYQDIAYDVGRGFIEVAA